jgi:hypothetical protein
LNIYYEYSMVYYSIYVYEKDQNALNNSLKILEMGIKLLETGDEDEKNYYKHILFYSKILKKIDPDECLSYIEKNRLMEFFDKKVVDYYPFYQTIKIYYEKMISEKTTAEEKEKILDRLKMSLNTLEMKKNSIKVDHSKMIKKEIELLAEDSIDKDIWELMYKILTKIIDFQNSNKYIYLISLILCNGIWKNYSESKNILFLFFLKEIKKKNSKRPPRLMFEWKENSNNYYQTITPEREYRKYNDLTNEFASDLFIKSKDISNLFSLLSGVRYAINTSFQKNDINFYHKTLISFSKLITDLIKEKAFEFTNDNFILLIGLYIYSCDDFLVLIFDDMNSIRNEYIEFIQKFKKEKDFKSYFEKISHFHPKKLISFCKNFEMNESKGIEFHFYNNSLYLKNYYLEFKTGFGTNKSNSQKSDLQLDQEDESNESNSEEEKIEKKSKTKIEKKNSKTQKLESDQLFKKFGLSIFDEDEEDDDYEEDSNEGESIDQSNELNDEEDESIKSNDDDEMNIEDENDDKIKMNEDDDEKSVEISIENLNKSNDGESLDQSNESNDEDDEIKTNEDDENKMDEDDSLNE